MYTFQPNLLIGFHGCSRDIGMSVINGDTKFVFETQNASWATFSLELT